MENLKETLELLYQLQEKDVKIFELKQNLINLPKLVEEKQKKIAELKASFENKKAEYVRLTSLKKEKEALLSAKEAAIAKHTSDLNTIKANDMYKNCLLEIEKAKADKSVVEDEILQLMEDIDKEMVNLKKYDEDTKAKEAEINKEIADAKLTVEKAKENIETIQKERDDFSKTIDKNILSQYERIRESRNGQGIATIDGESCSGCNMVLRPQLIVQATKCKELVYCDNCSRILFNKKGIEE
ncbi:zinc ribbon domain-containing protein [Candidatus Ruminimicrobiellum ovillum]|uniref:zinc ribbon domain-containing protein n=1 Tax=Candidatus Ruminimicrobiellum ovillum TaxID=1947927 RepID=UPI00355A186F